MQDKIKSENLWQVTVWLQTPQVRLLKGFVDYQVAKGAIPTIEMKTFKVVEEETDAIYLDEKELSAIYINWTYLMTKNWKKCGISKCTAISLMSV